MRDQMCHGMGVDSAALLTAAMDGDAPLPLGFDLRDLVVVTAMTGDESKRTKWAMETFLLPKFREHGIRYVQIARAGWSQTDGIEILSDTRSPYVMHMRGKVSLSEWFRKAGTIPQTSNRNCSYWAKGWVLDQFAAREFGTAKRRHIIGFAAEETGRRDRDLTYVTEKDGRQPEYPLIDWGWDREKCLAYLWGKYGIEWPRSCCGMCPFQAGPDVDRMGARWRLEPDQAQVAVELETRALALNPRMTLFRDRSARSLALRYGLDDAVAAADAEMAAQPSALYLVRRVHRRKGDKRTPDGESWTLGPDSSVKGQVKRSLVTVAEGSREDMLRELKARAGDGGELESDAAGARLWFERAGEPYPCTEEYLAVGPAAVPDKEVEWFGELWEFVRGLGLDRQLDLLSVGRG